MLFLDPSPIQGRFIAALVPSPSQVRPTHPAYVIKQKKIMIHLVELAAIFTPTRSLCCSPIPSHVHSPKTTCQDKLHEIDADLLGWWLAERQLPSGGFNGRPEKLPDVCYSWWVLTSLRIIGRMQWIDADKLRSFILACQDSETGGFSDRPGDIVDPFHVHPFRNGSTVAAG